MSTDTGISGHEPELRNLELRVGELIAMCEKLQAENQTLRRQHHNLLSERARLMEKNELARTRVEAMISRLKSMERET